MLDQPKKKIQHVDPPSVSTRNYYSNDYQVRQELLHDNIKVICYIVHAVLRRAPQEKVDIRGPQEQKVIKSGGSG